jgi:EAL and modified HD-GYP domain-containing signal transduction protein
VAARFVPVGQRTGASVHVARQAISDAQGRLYGYELLFRRDSTATSSQMDNDGATTTTILAAFSEFGAAELLGGKPGFINLTRAFLVGDLPLPFGPEAAVLEVIESVRLDREVILGALRLTNEGYRLALDDFVWTPEAEPLLAVADIAKIDVLAMSWDEVLYTAAKCRVHGVRLLAEKVENADMMQRCLDEGFELFQGYFLSRPETLTIETLSPGQSLALELVGKLGNPNTTTEEIEIAVRRDPALVYRLLRIANSASAGATRQVSSIRDALVMVGMSRLRAWLVLLSLVPDGDSAAGLVDALIRARTCERVARASAVTSPDVAFTAGLLDGVAESLGLTSALLLERMPTLTPELNDALAGKPGELRRVLDAVHSYERQDLAGASAGPVSLQTMAEAYLGALAWTTETTRVTELSSSSPTTSPSA